MESEIKSRFPGRSEPGQEPKSKKTVAPPASGLQPPASSLLFLFPFVLLLLPFPARSAPPLPIQGPAPLLHVRFLTPPGTHVTFYPTRQLSRTFDAPVTVGLRPGYIYRVKLSGFQPSEPNFYPTLEVRGTLRLPKVIRAGDHPAPLVFSQEDINRVLNGAMITKVVFLENPEQALATATHAERPMEWTTPRGSNPLAEADARGRPLLIVRLGQRDVSNEELASQAVPGTILLPGDKSLLPAAGPPRIPWACLPLGDPALGPRPAQEEFLHDGGDTGPRASVDAGGAIHGLDPTDTVASYTDSRGRRRLSASNRVCLCVPRFAIMREEIGLQTHESVAGVGGTEVVQGQSQVQSRLPSRATQQYEQLEAFRGRQRPSGAGVVQGTGRVLRVEVLNAHQGEIGAGDVLGTNRLHKLTREERVNLTQQMEFARQFEQQRGVRGVQQVENGPAVVGRVEGLKVVGQVQETRDLTVTCQEAPRAPDRPLHLYKWADARSAQVGDVVTFHLKYANHGGQPIEDVAVSDSLSGRLEYLPGSARSSRDAVFTTQENQAGSFILRWEVTGKLLPGESGSVRFQARVR